MKKIILLFGGGLMVLAMGLGLYLELKDRLEEPPVWNIQPEEVENTSQVPLAGTHWRVETTGSIMRWVPSGSFTMGSPDHELLRQEDELQISISVDQGFWLDQFEVTHKVWKQFVDDSGFISAAENQSNGYGTWVWDASSHSIIQSPSATWKNVHAHGDDYPVMAVNYYDAIAFCDWLTAKELDAGRLTSSQRYSLPTEVQWEYACRDAGAATTTFHFGDSLTGADVNFNGHFPYNAEKKYQYIGSTRPVGTYRPNSLGLFDMHGNTFEWCLNFYALKPEDIGNPKAEFLKDPESGELLRSYRGGSWFDKPQYCRSAFRGKTISSDRSDHLGFRVALIQTAEE